MNEWSSFGSKSICWCIYWCEVMCDWGTPFSVLYGFRNLAELSSCRQFKACGAAVGLSWCLCRAALAAGVNGWRTGKWGSAVRRRRGGGERGGRDVRISAPFQGAHQFPRSFVGRPLRAAGGQNRWRQGKTGHASRGKSHRNAKHAISHMPHGWHNGCQYCGQTVHKHNSNGAGPGVESHGKSYKVAEHRYTNKDIQIFRYKERWIDTHAGTHPASFRASVSQAEAEPASCRFFCCHCSCELWNRVWNRLSWFAGKLLPHLPLAPVSTAARVSTASSVSRGWSGTHAAGSRCPGWNRDSGRASSTAKHRERRQGKKTYGRLKARRQQLTWPGFPLIISQSVSWALRQGACCHCPQTTWQPSRHMCTSSSHSNKYTNININIKIF